MKLVVRLLLSSAAIFGVAYFSGGSLLRVDGWVAAAWAAVALGLVNLTVKPVVHVLAFPATILTLGVFALVINAFMLYIVAWIVPGVDTSGFLATMVAALVISVATSALTKLVESDDDRRSR
ncbi:MAG: phage holin family protein [Actinomycetota bacterium]|nr:phage holin family protein [Actinomycetota bacterium]